MLQQTQVSRVMVKFAEFLARFPTIADLARAKEQDVLAAWSGLGYYRRAKMLHSAARAIVEEHDGKIPDDADTLRTLPGIGPYTAGAIASIVFGRRSPTVDGNIRRVLLRIDGRTDLASLSVADRWAWERAAALVERTDRPGTLNESLMELGATICTPAQPGCAHCPVKKNCRAQRYGTQRTIPPPKEAVRRRTLYFTSVAMIDSRGRVLLEPRPAHGLWAGMWQPPTIEHPDRSAEENELLTTMGLVAVRFVESFEHATTHRRVIFSLWQGRARSGTRLNADSMRRWVAPAELAELPLANPHRRMIERAFSTRPTRPERSD